MIEYQNLYDNLIDLALDEDLGDIGDITTDATIPPNQKGTAKLISKEVGIVCGLDIFIRVFKKVDPSIEFISCFYDGDEVTKGDEIIKISGSLNSILKAERTALNFIQRLSGISTFSSRLKKIVSGSNTKILDTRKTNPAYRELEKYAVRTGGVDNHRIGLYDQFMIKDNHIEAAGSISLAVEKVKNFKEEKKLTALIEVEVKDVKELYEALATDVDVIMLDNMDNDLIKECIQIRKESKFKPKFEVSGNVTEKRVVELVDFGVDFISLGALTHSVKAMDYSLLVNNSEK